MVEERSGKFFPVQDNLPDILIITTVIMGYNGKGVAILQTDGGSSNSGRPMEYTGFPGQTW